MESIINHNLGTEERNAIAGIFSQKYYVSYFNGVIYVSHLLLQVFEGLGVLKLLKEKYVSADEIIAARTLAPDTKFVLEWTLSFLSQGGFLKKSQDGTRYHCEKIETIDLQELVQETVTLDSGIMPSVRLMEYVTSEYPHFFRGTKKGFEILFAQDKMALWNDYFSNNNSGYAPYNALGAMGMARWAIQENAIRILEVGAGTGGGTSALLDTLRERNQLSRISEYIFSDVSPVFLRVGNRAIMNRVPDDFNYSLKRLDFNKPFIGQGIKENDLDVVYGVNALHVAKDLAETLKNIYNVIKPGGRIIFSESCRPRKDYLLFQEIIFNLLDNYVNVDLNAIRPNPGFLDYGHWKLNLEAAGFKDIEAIFNTDGNYPSEVKEKANILAVVITARK